VATYDLTTARYGYTVPGVGGFNSAGGLSLSPGRQGIIHYEQIPEGNSYPSGDTVLTGATLTVGNSDLGATYVLGIVTGNEASPSASTVAKYQITDLLTVTFGAASQVIDLSLPQTNFAGTTVQVIPTALQMAWRRRNQSYVDPFTGLSDPHTLTFTFLKTAGVGTNLTTFTLTVTEAAADQGQIGNQYIRNWSLGIGSGTVYDGKTGEPMPADWAVQDGYTNMLVARENWDPRDRGAIWRRRLWPRTKLPRQVGGSGSGGR